jgi:(S)-2-hydroxyglutarate dehydrogenase
MAGVVRKVGATIELGVTVTAISESDSAVKISAGGREWQATKLIVCAGLQSDRLARMAGLKTDHQIVPFRGEYYRLPSSKNDIVRHLIYPIPDPDLPFLGVHLTRMIDGSVTVVPNAVLCWVSRAKAIQNFRSICMTWLNTPPFQVSGRPYSEISSMGSKK